VAILVWLLIAVRPIGARAEFAEFPPSDVTATQDRDQMMWQLGVSFPQLPPKLEDPIRPANAWPRDESAPEENWTDADGNTITRSGFGLWVNYDDDRAGDYSPIDLLSMRDGTRISMSEDWWAKRRPEVFHDVQELMWGCMPDASVLPAVTWSVTTSHGDDESEPYVEKSITGSIDTSRYPQIRNAPKIEAVLRIPVNARRPVPVIVVFGGGPWAFRGTWGLVAREGWGLCSLDPNALQPDNGAGLTSYLIGLVNQGRWRNPTDWGTLVAWSWGASRLIDYFESDKDVDASKIGITGHSRFGKAALVAMAYEPRLAIAYPSCGGALGTSMIRRHWGQDLENVSWDREYHWMAGNFFRWMGPLETGRYMPRKVELLPVDAHSLLALAAPRPVFLNGGTRDTWCDAYGTYLTAVGATPVYELLGGRGLVMSDDKPRTDVAYIDGNLGYRVHEGGHTPLPDWPAFIQFARRTLEPTSTSLPARP
jgi:hypothetical protein